MYILKILLHGCNGKMGQVITRLAGESQEPNAAFEIVCGVDLDFSRIKNSYPVYSSFDEVLDKLPVEKTPDVIIDFSHHSCIENLLRFATSQHIPLVICTTGCLLYTSHIERIYPELASRVVTINTLDMEKTLVTSDGSFSHSMIPRAYVLVLMSVIKDGEPIEFYRPYGGFGQFEDCLLYTSRCV